MVEEWWWWGGGCVVKSEVVKEGREELDVLHKQGAMEGIDEKSGRTFCVDCC